MNYLLIFCLSSFFLHCTALKKEKPSAQSLFQQAQKQAQRGYYLEANQVILKLKYQFPYSEYVSQSDLLTADILFDQTEFHEAQKSYRKFISLYPKHKDKMYAFYRQILSGSRQVPKESDRDLSASDEVLQIIEDFLKQHKNGDYVKKVKEIQMSLYDRRAKRDFEIAYFYFKQDKASAETLNRLDEVIDNYPQTPTYSKALNLALQIAKKLDDQKRVRMYLKILKGEKNG